MTFQEILHYFQSFQFKLFSVGSGGYENAFSEYVKMHCAQNRREARKKYRQSDPEKLIKRLLELSELFYGYKRNSLELDSAIVRYHEVSFWTLLLWTFESAVEIECQLEPHEVIKELDLKNGDYGTRNFEIYGTFGVLTRVIDKISRLDNLLSSDRTPSFESVSDSYKDSFNYTLIALRMLHG